MLDLGRVIRVTGAGLDVVEEVFLAQASIAGDVHSFDRARLLLRARPSHEEQGSSADKEAQNGEPDDAI